MNYPKPREGTETFEEHPTHPPSWSLVELPQAPRGDGNLTKNLYDSDYFVDVLNYPKPREGTETYGVQALARAQLIHG